jgi:hypothetical protein
MQFGRAHLLSSAFTPYDGACLMSVYCLNFMFRVRAEAHHPLHARAIVPAPVEEHHLSRLREMRRVALEIPLRLLPFRGNTQRNHAADARIHRFRDALNHSALARRVASLKKDHHLQLLGLHPCLQLYQLELQPPQLFIVDASPDAKSFCFGALSGFPLPW